MPQKQNFGVKCLRGATYRHEGRLPSPRGPFITLCYTPLVVGAGGLVVGSLKYFTPNFNIWELFDPPKNLKIHPGLFETKTKKTT